VTGIGFLGAGVILREGTNVHGLNTAATLWRSARHVHGRRLLDTGRCRRRLRLWNQYLLTSLDSPCEPPHGDLRGDSGARLSSEALFRMLEEEAIQRA
jgi:hypothetical protein